MKKRVITPILLIILLFVTAARALPTHAQAATQTQAIDVVTIEGNSDLQFGVLFTIYDANGNPVPRAQVQDIQPGPLQLVGSSSMPVTPTIEAADTPLKIVLVIDASGSMNANNYIAQVRDAAIRFVGAAPPQAEFAVLSFSYASKPELTQFTGKDHLDIITGAIRNIKAQQSSTGNTCIYNAAFDALNLLRNAPGKPEERRTIVLFTDGKDREGDTSGGLYNCTNGKAEVVDRATHPNNIPIYTVGACQNKSCAKVDKTNLAELARSTHAFSSLTENLTSDELDRVFNTILSGLNSQWIATAAGLRPSKGRYHADFSFRATLNKVPISFPAVTTGEFEVTKDYTSAPPAIKVNNRLLDESGGYYRLDLRLTSPGAFSKIIAEAWDIEAGSVIMSTPITTNIQSAMTITQTTNGLAVGHEYCTRIRGEGKDGK